MEAGLLSGTIRLNLELANPKVTDYDLWRVLKLVGMESVVRGFSQQLDTVVGERGVGMSGGQAQCISLARAYLKPSEMLFLD